MVVDGVQYHGAGLHDSGGEALQQGTTHTSPCAQVSAPQGVESLAPGGLHPASTRPESDVHEFTSIVPPGQGQQP